MRLGRATNVPNNQTITIIILARNLGAKYLYFSPLVPSKREKNKLVWLSLYIFEGSVFTFQFYHLQIEK